MRGLTASVRTLGAALALGSALSYGISDFLGGSSSRRIGSVQFTFISQVIGLLLSVVWVAASGDRAPGAGAVFAAAGAGVAITVALGAFFQAMVVGKMSVVAPVAATGAVIPVAAGVVGGDRLSVWQAVGMAAAVIGVVFAARAPAEGPVRRGESGVWLALLAAVGSGCFMWWMAPASRAGVPWATLVCRVIPVFVLGAIAATRRVSLRPMLRGNTGRMVLAGALSAFGGAAFYALATRHGQLATVSVLGSLYPAVTVLLAERVLHERIRRSQLIGIVGVLCGVVLLST